MDCDRYMELLSARMDGALTEAEERELEAHLAACPDCRAAGAQLAALRGAFPELEEIPVPEGFTQSVMDRIRAEEAPKVIPLFKRPQFRALAGLAACLVVVVGIYSVSQRQNQEKMMLVTRSFQQDVTVEETDGVSACESLSGDEDSSKADGAASLEEVPRIAAYAAPSPAQADTSAGTAGTAPEVFGYGVTPDMQKAAPNADAGSYDGDQAYAEAVLTLERMPEGGWELIPPETPVSPDGLTVSAELMEQLEQLAVEQGIGTSRVSGPEVNDHCLIVILDEAE